MANRRDFLRVFGGASAGFVALSYGFNAIAQSPRREIMIGGRRVYTVDIHAHCVIPSVSQLTAGTEFADVGMPPWQALGPERIDVMNQRGIDYQALSVNRYWWYAADEDLAARVVRHHDEAIAEWVQQHPDRFVGLSSVALNHPELAAEQLEYAITQLGHRGASIAGHVMGEHVSDPRFDPFWAKAEELEAAIFMHPNGALNAVREGGLAGRGDLGNIIGNPLETTIFLSHLIYEGVLDRFPGLRVVAAHGGGYMPSYLGRSEVACAVRNNANCLNEKNPSDYLRENILVDTIVFDEEGLRHLVAEMGTSQIVYGTDIPFNWPDTLDVVLDSPSLKDAEKAEIVGGNL
ncbi:MAG TPA: amidohydrolase family protein, partial [Gammaproteobacteria bacterium]